MSSTESQLMTNVIADPTAKNTVGENHARQRVDVCRVVVPASPGAGELLRLTTLQAHDRVISILHLGDADANMSDVNIGIYTPSDSTTDPVAIDDNGLVEAVNIATADLIPTEILGTGLTNPQDFGKALWEYAGGGPTSEPIPGTQYEIVAEIVGDAVGSDHTFLVIYTSGD